VESLTPVSYRRSMRSVLLIALALAACESTPEADPRSSDALAADAGPTDAAPDGPRPDAARPDAQTPDAAAPEPVLVVDADFEDRALGDACGGPDGFDESFSRSVRDDTHVFRGEHACRLGVPQGRNGFGSFGGIINGKLGRLHAGDEVWIRLALYVPADFEFNEGRSKFVRLRTFEAAGEESWGYLDWYLATRDDRNPHHWIYEGTQQWRRKGNPAQQVVRDAWETYEVYYHLDDVPVSEGGDARIRLWKNGELVAEITDQRTLVEPDGFARGLLIFTYFGNEGSPRDQNLWLDDLQVAIEEPPLRDAAGNPFLGG